MSQEDCHSGSVIWIDNLFVPLGIQLLPDFLYYPMDVY